MEIVGGWVVRLDEHRLLRQALVLGVILAGVLCLPAFLATPSAVAQEREYRAPRGELRARRLVDTGDESDGGIDGKRGTPRKADAAESMITSIFHASAPIVVVTVVIAVMSFYLIALVVWMAIHYRTPAAIPPDLIRDVQMLLEQNKFNEAYHRLVAGSSFLARVLASGVRKLPSGVSQGLTGHGAGERRHHHGNGTSNDVPGDGGHARTDDRPGGNSLRHDHGVPCHRDRG